MQDNQDEQALEQYLQKREQEVKHQGGDQINQELSHKRDYIKQQIVEKYAGDEEKLQLFAQHFLRYLRQKKSVQTQAHNLELLSINELEEIVTNFQRQYPDQKNDPSAQIDDIYKSMIFEPEEGASYPKLPEANSFNPKKVYYSNGAWDYELIGYQSCKPEKAYFDQKQCQKSIVVVFGKVQTKKNGGFFGIGGSLELWIEIKNNIFKEVVQRTAQDFLFLRQALTKSFPYTYVPPLDFNQKMLAKVDVQQIKFAVQNECRRFINAVCKNEMLFESFYTFRFFKEIKYQNYIEHKKELKKVSINHLKLLKNKEGVVSIQISDQNQVTKKDYNRKSEYLQRMWRNVSESNGKIIQKLKQIQKEIDYQKKQFQLVLVDISHSNTAVRSECYQKLSDVLLCYSDVYRIYKDNLISYQKLFESVNIQLAWQAQRNWKAFLHYKTQVQQFSNQYQAKRKAFLDQSNSKQSQSTNKGNTQQPEGSKIQNKSFRKQRISIISELGIEEASERQMAWIERYSKWQAYINSQFSRSFQRLVDNDREILRRIMQQTAHNVLETKRIQQQSFISHLSVIS